MLRRIRFALAMVSALTGCVAAPPPGPLVEYHEGLAPTTREVKCEANYVLVAKDAPSACGQIAEHHLVKGERVGFRGAADGTVTAVAPGYTLPLPPGTYSWDVVRASVPPLHERVWCETRERAVTAGKVTGWVVGTTCLLMVGLGAIVGYAYAKDKTDQANTTNKR